MPIDHWTDPEEEEEEKKKTSSYVVEETVQMQPMWAVNGGFGSFRSLWLHLFPHVKTSKTQTPLYPIKIRDED